MSNRKKRKQKMVHVSFNIYFKDDNQTRLFVFGVSMCGDDLAIELLAAALTGDMIFGLKCKYDFVI